jgi:hypothetical protein
MPVVLGSKSKRRNAKIDQDQERIATSLKRFKITAEAESEYRRTALEDLRFSIGTGQWDEAVKANREIEGKPCLTINRAPAFLRQYTGEERQHRPAMLVSPVGSGADIEVAKIHQGFLRHTEVVSRADVTYDSAYDMMMRIGGCPWRVNVDFINDNSFDQEPRIEAIENPFAAYLSPVRRPDGTDPLWGHIVRDYQKDDYEAEFGKTPMVKLSFPTSQGNAEPSWVTKDGCRVAEYWFIDLIPRTLLQFADGSIGFADDLEKTERDERGKFRKNPKRDMIVGDREVVTRKVRCLKHDALHVIKEYEWLGRYLPFPEVNGVRLNVNGKIYKAGMVRDYRDAQRIYDFMVTRQVEQVDMVSKDPLWVAAENAEYGEDYRQMNRKNFSHLYHKAYDEQGRPLPMPQRAGREAPIAAMTEVIKQADYDMKSVIGIYGPSLGEESGNAQESGFAIMTRQQQSDTGAVSWHENLNQAIIWQGVILLDLWPKLVPAARVQRIINPDDSVKHAVVFNSQYSDGQAPPDAQMLLFQMGLKKAYDVGAGEYDLTLSTGPQYKTARAEGFKAISAVIQSDPQQMIPILGDIWIELGDFPKADVVAKRLKKLLPPQLQDTDNEDAEAKLTAASAQIAALGAQNQQLIQEVTRAADTIRTKRLDLESRERIALLNNFTQITLQRMKSNDAAAQGLMDAQLAAITQRLSVLHENLAIGDESGPPVPTPELPGQVEPRVQPVTPAAPTPRPQPIA